jgi:multidrug efflux pump subunit AcrA (membrane-fusion protein)
MSERASQPHPGHGLGRKVWQVLQVVQARLRFVALLLLLGLVFSSWGTLSNTWEKWTRVASAEPPADPDVEYFCPMHPTVVRDHPGEKCPICHMDLARRKKGAGNGEPLAPGTVSRVQLTPYRQVLAGVQTAAVRYRELAKDVTAFGTVEFNETKQAHIAATVKGRILKQYVNFTGQSVAKGENLAELDVRYSTDLNNSLADLRRARQNRDREAEQLARQRLRVWDLDDQQVEHLLHCDGASPQLTIASPIKGHVIKKLQREGDFVDEGTALYDVADLDTVWIEAQVYEADQALVHEGQKVEATTLARPNEPFVGVVSFIYPHLDEDTRTLTIRMELANPGHRLRPGDYATVKVHVPPQQVPAVAAADVQTQLRQGRVLAVPDSAVIDTGSLQVVYREAAPDAPDSPGHDDGLLPGAAGPPGGRSGGGQWCFPGRRGDPAQPGGGLRLLLRRQRQRHRNGGRRGPALDAGGRGGPRAQGAVGPGEARPRGPPAGRGAAHVSRPGHAARLDGRAGQGVSRRPARVPVLLRLRGRGEGRPGQDAGPG